MNEVKKVILFLLCCAIPFSFYAQKARQNAVTKKWGYEQTENKGWWENSKYRGNSMFGGWDAALVNQDYEINWLISPQYEGVTKRFTEKLAGVVLGGKVGFIDIYNRFIIKPQFENADDIHGFNLGLSAVKNEGGNLAASKIRNLECPSYEICLIDYGCGKFNRKIHIKEQYP